MRRCGRPPQAPFYERLIRACGVVPQREAWKPGTDGLYPRPRGARPPTEHSTRLPVWNPRVEGVRRQQAMLDTADRLSVTSRSVLCSRGCMDQEKRTGLGLREGIWSFSQRICVHSTTLADCSAPMLLRNHQGKSSMQSLFRSRSIPWCYDKGGRSPHVQ
jgi:hypothetical protein